ncbi:MAG TPA: hypothetical protein VJZ27_18350, partial [Aggregatilineales bacterium]|nr:hypothetical protein [Aggregatilineales bacterium]
MTLSLVYSLRIPPILDGYPGHWGYLGYSDHQINLGHWMPVLAMYREDWYAPRAHIVGEQTTTPTSDFDVTLEVIKAPPTIDVAGPGKMQV